MSERLTDEQLREWQKRGYVPADRATIEVMRDTIITLRAERAKLVAALLATLPSLAGRDIALRDHINLLLAKPAESGATAHPCGDCDCSPGAIGRCTRAGAKP